MIASVALFIYQGYDELTRVSPYVNRFPPEVATQLRRALYFTEVTLDPARALEEYKLALKVAIEKGLHPYSDEVVGIKIQVAAMLEKAGLIKPSIDVLERTKKNSLEWIKMSREQASTAGPADYKEEARKRKKALAEAAVARGEAVTVPAKTGDIMVTDEDVQDTRKRMEDFARYEERQRGVNLKRVVGIELKLAELYASDHIQEDKKAEECQIAAVELCLKELQRRQALGLPIGGGRWIDSEAWLTLTEMATALVELASGYIEKGSYGLALPLYLRALDFICQEEDGSPTCKQVELLNGVSTAMAGQAQMLPSLAKAGERRQQQLSSPATPSRENIINAAKQWAQKALDVASTIKPPVRDEGCDSSCVAATYNLGELAMMANQRNEATKRYREAESLARATGFEDGVTRAQAALKRMRS